MTVLTKSPAPTPPEEPQVQPPKRRGKSRGTAASLWEASPLTYICLIVAAVISAFPIFWSFIVSSRTNSEINRIPPPLTPGPNFWRNVQAVFDNEQAAFLIGIANSFIVSSVVTVSVVLTSSLAGFAFGKLRFRGKNALLLTVIVTMMVPVQMTIIPLYLMMVKIGWAGDVKAVIAPFLAQGLGVFLMRQYTISAVPDELIEATRMDGCSTWGTYWHVILPAVRPMASILGLIIFMQTWNDFLWPYVVLTPDTPTVQYSLKILSSATYSTDYVQMFTGVSLATIPLLLIFLAFGKQIIGNVMEGAVKG